MIKLYLRNDWPWKDEPFDHDLKRSVATRIMKMMFTCIDFRSAVACIRKCLDEMILLSTRQFVSELMSCQPCQLRNVMRREGAWSNGGDLKLYYICLL